MHPKDVDALIYFLVKPSVPEMAKFNSILQWMQKFFTFFVLFKHTEFAKKYLEIRLEQ